MKSYTVILMFLMTICMVFVNIHQAQCGGQQHVNEAPVPNFKAKTYATVSSIFGGFDFNSGDCEGWTAYGPLDEDGDGPFFSNFCFSWSDVCDYPTIGLTDPIGNNKGSLKICCAGCHGITNPGADYWAMYFVSPDLSSSALWQNTDGYSVKIYNGMELIGPAPGEHLMLYVNLHVTIYDHDEMKDRYFCCYSSAEPIDNYFVSNEWISLKFDWSSIISTVPNYTVKEISVAIWGSMDDYFEGGIYLDEVNVRKPLAVPMLDLSILLDYINDHLDRGTSSSKMLSLKNKGSSNLTFNLFAVPTDCVAVQKPRKVSWITFNPKNGVVKPDSLINVSVKLDASFLLPGIYNANIKLVTNDPHPQNNVVTIPVKLTVKPKIKRNITYESKFEISASLPCDFGLLQNYPNPFNPSTTITFNLPESKFVTMNIFNITGRKIATLINGNYDEGEHHINWIANDLPSGVYLCVLKVGDIIQTKKLILEK